MIARLTPDILLEKLEEFGNSRFIYEDDKRVIDDLLFSTPDGREQGIKVKAS